MFTRVGSEIGRTEGSQDADERKALGAGFDRHLTKPVDPEKLELSFDV